MGYIGQAEDEWEWEQEKKRRKQRKRDSVVCPTCKKRISKKGLRHHLKDAHNQKLIIPNPKTIEVENIKSAP